MRCWIVGPLCGLLAGLSALPTFGGDDTNPYRRGDGKLRHALRLEDVAPGDGGVRGQVWVIEPSGQWHVGRIERGKEAGKPLRAGSLTPRQLAALANHLATQDLLHLPKEFGETLPVAPHLVILRFGDRSATLNCGTVDELTEVAPSPGDRQASAYSRFIALVFVIKNMTRKALPPPEDKGS